MVFVYSFQDNRNRHRSPLKSCLSPNGRNVRFCSPESSPPQKQQQQEQGDRSASSSSSEEEDGDISPPKTSRGSSLVRVCSRSNSPICETFVASALPSKSTGEVSTEGTSSVACECNLPPACLPKPQGNLKYSHILKPMECSPPLCDSPCVCQCQPCNCDVHFPPPPPQLSFIEVACDPCEIKQVFDRCTNAPPECRVVDCCQVIHFLVIF